MIYPKISIVTPSFNQGQYIEENIRSVIDQNYPNVEHIIIDGGSKDNTVEILKKYGHCLNWVSEPDKGQSHALNKGFQKATGEIVGWINSDDFMLPGALHSVAEYFLNNPNVMALVGDLLQVNENGKKLSIDKGRRYTHEYLLNEAKGIIQPSTFFKRNLIERIGDIDISLSYAMDYEYFLRITLESPIEYLPNTLAAFRKHSNSKTSHGAYYFAKDIIKIRSKFGGKILSTPVGRMAIYLILTEPLRRVDGLYSLLKYIHQKLRGY